MKTPTKRPPILYGAAALADDAAPESVVPAFANEVEASLVRAIVAARPKVKAGATKAAGAARSEGQVLLADFEGLLHHAKTTAAALPPGTMLHHVSETRFSILLGAGPRIDLAQLRGRVDHQLHPVALFGPGAHQDLSHKSPHQDWE